MSATGGRRLAPGLALLLVALARSPPARSQQTDCTAFDSQIWAQSVFETNPTRYAALDPHGNGLACEALPPGAATAWWTDAVPVGAVPATLASVTDGDTIRAIVNGVEEPVRFILIDTPETNDPNKPPECYGQEATNYPEWLLSLGRSLYLESDVSDRDRFNWQLRYAWLDFGDGKVYLVNEVMARSGYAVQPTFPPDVKYEEEIWEAARFAREHGYGLWSGCVTDAEGDTNELDTVPAAPAPDRTFPEPEQRRPEPEVIVDPPEAFGCDGSYPDLCVPPLPPDLDCAYVYDQGMSHITVLPPDPHGFDGNGDGVGCEGG